MFTGIVEELGEIVAIEEFNDAARLTVRGPLVTADAVRGDSIAINGVCLTVTGFADGTFSADVISETLIRSSLGALAAGSPVNLERPMRLDDRLGGDRRTDLDLCNLDELPLARAAFVFKGGQQGNSGVHTRDGISGPLKIARWAVGITRAGRHPRQLFDIERPTHVVAPRTSQT